MTDNTTVERLDLLLHAENNARLDTRLPEELKDISDDCRRILGYEKMSDYTRYLLVEKAKEIFKNRKV